LPGLDRCTEATDPNRCQGTTNSGQCWNVAEHGSKFCKAHCGVSTKSREEIRSYLVSCAETKARLAELAYQPDYVVELNYNLAVTHNLTERILKKIEDNSDASMKSWCGPLESLQRTSQGLVKTVVAVQKELGELLPRQRLALIGSALAQILIDELDGIEGYDEIALRIINRVSEIVEKPPQLESPSV
jgi:hypothetical protein